MMPASVLKPREGRLPVEAQAGVTKVTVAISGDPTPVCREALAEVAKLGLRHMRLGFGLGGGFAG